MKKKMKKAKNKKELSIRTKLANWSKAIRARDGNKCVICGATEHVQAHHILPKKGFKQFMFEEWNGISLCPSHHRFGKCSVHMGGGAYFFHWMYEHRNWQLMHIFDILRHMEYHNEI